jgi:hypothetical protein
MQQTQKLSRNVGSFFNYLMSNNQSIPQVGKGATQMHYTDRTCYEVIEVSKDLKKVKLEYLEAEAIKDMQLPTGHQTWNLKPTGYYIEVVYRHNAWRKKVKVVQFTDEFIKTTNGFSCVRALTTEQIEAIYGNEVYPQNVVEGITEEVTEYHKINILFGVKDYYYDWSF